MRLTERLTVNDVVIPISGYSIQAPTDGMGQSITIALAKPDITSIPLDADITFEIGAEQSNGPGFDVSYAPPIIENGRLNGRSYNVKWIPDERGGYPGDVIEFTSLSPIADKWSLSPFPPVIVVDPNRYENPESLIPPESERIISGSGFITPVLEQVPDMMLHAVMHRAYVTGCGFAGLVTNLPNFPVDRVDFTLEGGYHAPVKSLISFLNPISFEYAGGLWVISPELGMPSGLTVKTMPHDCVIEVTQSLNPELLSNAVILTYKTTGAGFAGELPQERIINDDPIESGTGKSYTRQETARHITEYVDVISGAVRRVQEQYVEVRNYAYRDNIIVSTDGEGNVTRERTPGGVVLISEERIENTYIGNTKSGHVRTINAIYPNPEAQGADAFGEVLREECSLRYGADEQHPGESVLTYSENKTSGIVVKETRPDGYVAYTPIIDAGSGNIIESDNTQTLLTATPIETTLTRLRPTAQNQVNVESTIVDHLNGQLRTVPPVDSRVGTRSTYFPPFTIGGHRPGYIREWIPDAASIALYGVRKPFVLDIGNLDPATGRELALIRLKHTTKPPKRFAIILPGIDFSIRRGTVLIPPLRSGFDNKVLVTGYNISASGIGTEQARRTMSLDCRELLIDS